MRGPAGLVASALLPLFRFVTARLEAAAAPAGGNSRGGEATVSALRERYPDAPQAWIDLVASRLGGGEDLQVDRGRALPVDDAAPARAPSMAAARFARDDEPVAAGRRGENRPEVRAADLPRTEPDFPRIEPLGSRSSPVFPSRTARGQPRRAIFTVKDAAAPYAAPRGNLSSHGEPAAVRRFEPAIEAAAAKRPEAPEAQPGSPPPRRPILRFLPEHSTKAVSAAYRQDDVRRQGSVPMPVFAAEPPAAAAPPVYAAPVVALDHGGPAWPLSPAPSSPRANSAKPASAPLAPPPSRARFDTPPREAAQARLFPAQPPIDRWPDLPAPPVSPALRAPDDGERLRRLIEDQTERSWNG